MNELLVDTSFLVALNNKRDRHHQASVHFANTTNLKMRIPDVVLTETAFLIDREAGVNGLANFINRLIVTKAVLQPLILEDLQQAREILLTYRDSHFDFVDCCIMALAQRLNITQICTFDRRDFSIFRPTHCKHLELLPG